MKNEVPEEAQLILSIVCGEISLEKLLSKDRTPPLPHKRKVSTYLLRRETGMKVKNIAKLFTYSSSQYASTIVTEIHEKRFLLPDMSEDLARYERTLKEHYLADKVK